jgi:hypothetical protein
MHEIGNFYLQLDACENETQLLMPCPGTPGEKYNDEVPLFLTGTPTTS